MFSKVKHNIKGGSYLFSHGLIGLLYVKDQLHFISPNWDGGGVGINR